MTNINKILLLFLAIIMTSFIVIWEFVQSETFAGILSKNVTKYTKEILGADLKFDRVEFKLFPPGVEVNNVILRKENNEQMQIYTNVTSLGVSFDVFDFFETDLTIDKLYLKDGELKIKAKVDQEKKENTKKNEIDFKISQELKRVRELLPFTLKNISLNKIDFEFNENSILTHKANLYIERDRVTLNLGLRNFNLAQMKLYEEIIDELDVSVVVSDEEAVINRLLITKDLAKLEISGAVDEYLNLEEMEWEVTGTLTGNIADIHKYLDFKEVGSLDKGIVKVALESEGSVKDYEVNAVVNGWDIVTDFANADRLLIETNINKENIVFKRFDLKHSGGSLTLAKPFEFFNFESKKFVEENIFVKANKLKMSNALRYLRETLGILRGRLTGDVEFNLGANDFHFLLNEKVYVDELKLTVGAGEDSLLHPKQITLNTAKFDIVGSDVDIFLDAQIDKSKFKAVGAVRKNGVTFGVKKGKIAISELGKIAGFSMSGLGDFDLDVVVNKSEQVIKIKPTIDNYTFEGFQQEKMSAELEIDLQKNWLAVNKLNGNLGQTTTKGYFKLNLEDLSVDSKIRQERILISDIKRIYAPALKDITFLSEKMYGDWATEVQISGKLNMDDLVIDGHFVGQNSFLFGESLDLVQLKYALKNNIFSLNDLYLTKASGALHGGMNYSLKNSNLLFWGNINKVPLAEINNYSKIPSTLRGDLSGVFKGSLVDKKINMDSEINISNSQVHGRPIGDSYLTIKANESVVDYSAKLLGKVLQFSGKIYLDDKKKDSNVKWKVDAPDLNKILSVLSFVDHLKTGFSGRAKLQGDARFKFNNFKKASGRLEVNQLNLSKGKVKLEYQNRGGAQIIVQEGEIKNWDVDIRGSKFYISSKGEGDINSRYDIKTRVKADATLLEVFNVLISKSSGTLLGSVHNYKTLFDEDYVAKLVSNNLTMSSDFVPVELKRGDLLVSYKKKKFILNKLKAQLNAGTLFVNGVVDISRLIPDINIRYEFKNAGIPLLKKSSLTFSGKGSLVGKTFPYTLGGEISILKCNIVNEVTDFIGGDEIIKTEIDYLPKDKSQALNQLVNFNINLNTLEPIRITNSMVDLGFTGNLILTGGEREPRLAGKISLAPIKNQIFFKNNTFDLSKGNVFFYERNKVTNPELDFLATSVINKYNVSIGVLGQLQEFKMDLTSDPILSQSDILSLIAFGYTEDLSTNLSDNERESMTRAGVGSIIFDRFKINETLKNEFGLQVNLGTEISQEEGSYLSQRNAEGGEIGRVRSATTIEVKKQISESIDLSVSSTVGGTVGQKQSMNLNYNLNKNLSVEGVYESNSQIQSEELNNDSSLGADVKIRWSFK